MLEINKNSFVPIYYQVKESIKSKIISGALSPGDKIDTELEISQKYGISRVSARRAVTELLNDGLIIRTAGKGTFIKEKSQAHPSTATGNIAWLYYDINDLMPQGQQTMWFIINDLQRGIFDSVAELGWNLSLFALPPYKKGFKTDKKLLSRLAGFSGLISLSRKPFMGLAQAIVAQNIPLVQIGEPDVSIKGAARVWYDSCLAASMAAEYIISKGFKKILLIESTEKASSNTNKINSFLKALDKKGIRIAPGNTIKCGYSEIDGYLAMKKHITENGHSSFDAIFGVTDTRVMGAIRALSECGIRVPEDVSVLGYNDEPSAEKFSPPLTTVAVPRYHIGVTAVKILQKILNGKEIPDFIEVKPCMKIRKSC